MKFVVLKNPKIVFTPTDRIKNTVFFCCFCGFLDFLKSKFRNRFQYQLNVFYFFLEKHDFYVLPVGEHKKHVFNAFFNKKISV